MLRHPAAPAPTDLTHLTISLAGRLAAARPTPDLRTVQGAVTDALPPMTDDHARQALRQNLTAHLHTYLFPLRPPEPWTFDEAAPDLGIGPRPLQWTDPARRVLADLVHSGPGWRLRAPAVTAQIEQFRIDRVDQFGDRLIGVRALCVREPRLSQLVRPDGRIEPLSSSPYHRMAVRRG